MCFGTLQFGCRLFGGTILPLFTPSPPRLLFYNRIDVFVLFEEIGHIEKRVALQAKVDKRRLHAWKHARYPAFINASRQRRLATALEEDFDELVVFKNRSPCFMAIGPNHQFLTHASPPLKGADHERTKIPNCT